ncbi:hypothetical protein [Thiohalocapsa sp. ML1]|jgi:hypothetical protein|uniref:hypothetical protein n=1 Tax=Thiohalocapsa sp. ML1 TaxID=1431688 RepID=UPI000731FCB7|nr:hypothetical protein [Thiohalocapsa sp. ML1]
MSAAAHLVVYHKQSTSARLRFLRPAHGGICTDAVLPATTVVHPGACGAAGGPVRQHPGILLRNAEAALSLPRGCIESDGGFRCHVVADGVCAEVHLAQFKAIDPPLAAAAAAGASFIELSQARGMPAPELALLRLVYEHVLG